MSEDRVAIPRRIYHIINLICMVALVITGLYIHKPFVEGYMNTMRQVHFIFMYIFATNIMLRVYWAFMGARGDWKKYLKQDFSTKVIKATFRHYLLYEHYPKEIKDRILQNSAYLGVVILFGLQIATGILLYYPESLTLAPYTAFLGGLALVRTMHFFLMWVFITFTVIHFYMAVAEEAHKIKAMLTGIE